MEMEKMTLPKFDHNAENLDASLGITQQVDHYIRSAIVFECIACPMLVEELFDDVEDAPRDLSTMTGILERVNSHMRTVQEQMYMLLIFREGYIHIFEIIGKGAAEIERATKEGVRPGDSVLASLITKMTGSPTMSIADVVTRIKKHNFNFDSFVSEMLLDSNYDADGNFIPQVEESIDPEALNDFLKDMLKKAIQKRKDDEAKKKGEDNN